MKRLGNLILIYIVAFIAVSSNLYGWENKLTHPAITKEAVTSSSARIDDYLKNELSMER